MMTLKVVFAYAQGPHLLAGGLNMYYQPEVMNF
jgi:hypothetical protein